MKIIFCIVAILLSLLSCFHGFGQDYSFPITDWPNYIQHNLHDSVCVRMTSPKRGTIFGRNAKVLAADSVLYDLIVKPGQVKKQDIAIICRILKITSKEFNQRLNYARNWQDPRQPLENKTPDRPAPFKGLLSKHTADSLFKTLPAIQPGFSLEKRAVRHYPFNTAGNILGYIKTGNVAETGIEERYDSLLRGMYGLQFWNCDHKNTPVKRVMAGKLDVLSEKGKDIYTSIDIPLQLLGEKLMKGKRGSIVAIDPATGDILAMVSSPAYSPEQLALNRNAYFPTLLTDAGKPMFNRTIASVNSPGSVFKLFQGLVALKEGLINARETFYCNGSYTLCDKAGKPKCHVEGVHRPNLVEALAISCNSYFADVFRKIIGPSPQTGLSRWTEAVKQFGFGGLTGVDLPGEKRGLVPDTTLYNKKYRQQWNSCTIISNAIGQGELTATVLQLANAIAIVANKGWYYQPHLVDSIAGIKGNFKSNHQKITAFDLPDSLFELVHQGMYETVQGKNGTARKAAVKGLTICGKTGTVENGNGQPDHSVFAAFAPRQHPRIAIVCLVENGGFGAEIAAPVVGQLIKEYLQKGKQGFNLQ